MDRFLKIVLYSIPILACAGLAFYICQPHYTGTGPRAVLSDVLRASNTIFPCPQYEHVREALVNGGPPKDGIPAVNRPIFISAQHSGLDDDERVYGIDHQGFTAAFPEYILLWHEVVNQETKTGRISITYCPLTRSAIGYAGYTLGVTGMLYNSNLVMYDRKTQSRIPQILGRAIDGELCGLSLPSFPATSTTWGRWKQQYPDTLVMTPDTGYSRSYGIDPYGAYYTTPGTLFPLTMESMALPEKSMVLALESGECTAAVAVDGFQERYPAGLTFVLGDRTVSVYYDHDLEALRAEDDVRQMQAYWFAWYAQHPETKVFD